MLESSYQTWAPGVCRVMAILTILSAVKLWMLVLAFQRLRSPFSSRPVEYFVRVDRHPYQSRLRCFNDVGDVCGLHWWICIYIHIHVHPQSYSRTCMVASRHKAYPLLYILTIGWFQVLDVFMAPEM